jgi:hypothetical protein
MHSWPGAWYEEVASNQSVRLLAMFRLPAFTPQEYTCYPESIRGLHQIYFLTTYLYLYMHLGIMFQD